MCSIHKQKKRKYKKTDRSFNAFEWLIVWLCVTSFDWLQHTSSNSKSTHTHTVDYHTRPLYQKWNRKNQQQQEKNVQWIRILCTQSRTHTLQLHLLGQCAANLKPFTLFDACIGIYVKCEARMKKRNQQQPTHLTISNLSTSRFIFSVCVWDEFPLITFH